MIGYEGMKTGVEAETPCSSHSRSLLVAEEEDAILENEDWWQELETSGTNNDANHGNLSGRDSSEGQC